MKLTQKIWQTSWNTRLTLLDQVMVSGSNFLLGVLLTRWMGLESYGVFALAWMGVILASSLQQAGILAPMMSLGPKMPDDSQSNYYAATQRFQGVFAFFIGCLAVAVILLSDWGFPSWQMGGLFPVLPLVIMAFVMQEYYRRYFFIKGQPREAFIIDGLAYLGMIGGIGVLFLMDHLSVFSALGIIAGSFGVATMVGMIFAKLPFSSSYSQKSLILQHSKFSSWLIGTAILQFFSGNYYLIAAGIIIGPTAVGALRIVQNLMGVTHVLFLAMENVVPVKAALAYAKDGWEGMRIYLTVISLKSGVLVGGILFGIALTAKYLLIGVYGNQYLEYSYLLVAYCFFYAFLFPGYPLRYALRAIEHTKPIFIGYVLSTILSLLTAKWMVANWQLMGVVYGLIATQILMQGCYGVLLVLKGNSLKTTEKQLQ